MKKFKNIFLIILLIYVTPVLASTKTYERTEEDLGVNKNWIITEQNKSNVLATPRVNADEKIYDFAEVITEEDEATLFNLAKNFINKTNMDIVIVTINVESTYDGIEDYVETYGSDFYDYNDFGLNFEKYSGLIIVRNVHESSRYFNIFTFGNAQLYYPYNRCENILDAIYDDLANDNYLSGFTTFISESLNYYDSGYEDNNYYVDDTGHLKRAYEMPIGLALIIATIVTAVVVGIFISKNKMVKKARNANEYLDDRNVKFTRREDKFVGTHTTSHQISSSSGGGSFGGSSTGSSGGGHGGGGGRHG